MKRLVIALMMFLPMAAIAQDNSWEQTENTQNMDPKRNPKYLAGAVPEVDGKVVFETVIKAPGKSQKQLYDLLLEDFTSMTKVGNITTRDAAEAWEADRIATYKDNHHGDRPQYNQNDSGK